MDHPASPSRSSAWKWWIIGLLLLATMVNYMDRQTLGGMAARIKGELSLSETQYGNLETSFGLAFAAGSLVFGFLADRVRTFWLYPAVLAAWSAMGMIAGRVEGYSELLLCRTLLGFFEAGHWPCALKTTFALLDSKERTMGNSILQSGASLGAIITPQIIRLMLTPEIGAWRSVFIVVGGAGLVWVLLWFASLRPRDLETSAAEASEATGPSKAPGAEDFVSVLLSRRLWAVGLLLLGPQVVWHICRAWLTLFLQTGRGYSEAEALNFSSLFFIASDAGCLLAGAASLWLARAGRMTAHMARRRVYLGGCVLTSLSLLLPLLGRGPGLLATLLLIAAGALALFPCYYGFVQDLSAHHVGRLTGILSAFGWAIASPVHTLFGKIADSTGSYDMGLLVAGLVPWLGVVSMAVLWGREKA